MKPPDFLTNDHARQYWERHAPRLSAAGLLTDADVESFALLCETWGNLRECQKSLDHADDSKVWIRYIALSKQFQALGKQYGQLAKDRKQSKMDDDKKPPDQFGL